MKALNIVVTLLHRSHRNLLLRNAALRPSADDFSARFPATLGQLWSRCMAGHSKWQNIKDTKTKNDMAKSKAFNHHAYVIRQVVMSGGPNPNLNSKLAAAIKDARTVFMPNATIEGIIKRALNKELKMTEIEVLGPGGCLVVLEVESANPAKTVHDVKVLLKKTGFVRIDDKETTRNDYLIVPTFRLGMICREKRSKSMFETKGVIRVSGKKDGSKLDVDKAMEDAILADAEDVQESVNEDGNTILTFTSSHQDFPKMKKWFGESDYVLQDCGAEYVPRNPIDLSDDNLELASQLCSQLEEMEDILRVTANIR